MEITIFSDAVCTWSYGEEKVLRAIDYLYDGKVKFNNIMGGLIADYHDILPMNMKDKDDNVTANNILLQIWKAGNNMHHMPVMKDIPNLISKDSPSTYKVDIGFVAARLTDESKANLFLRKLREATILDGKNTMDNNVLADIAESVGMDREVYLDILTIEAPDEFLNDRMASFDRRLLTFPNFMYTDEKGKEFLIKGYKKKEDLINFISEHSDLKPKDVSNTFEEVVSFIKKYDRVFLIELYEVFHKDFIDNLVLENRLEVFEVGNGKEVTLKRE